MQRRYNLTHLILAGVVVLVLTSLMVCVEVQAQIAFASQRDGHFRKDIPEIPAPEIYVMDDDGENQQRLTNNPSSDYSPSWSPDGKRIAFVSDRDGHVDANGWLTAEIYVMDDDGGNPQNLTNNPSDDRTPSWSPDGKRIVFSSDRDMGKGEAAHNVEIYVMDADGKNQQRLTKNLTEDKDPSWSPDGERIVFRARRPGHFIGEDGITYEIYVMDADGQNEQRLTENRVFDEDPSWSPDGKRIVFWSNREADIENTEIYAMDADGGNPQNLTNNPHGDANPAWFNSPFSVSPSGKKFTMWGQLKQVNQ